MEGIGREAGNLSAICMGTGKVQSPARKRPPRFLHITRLFPAPAAGAASVPTGLRHGGEQSIGSPTTRSEVFRQ